MENTIKLLSHQKNCRIVLVNTEDLLRRNLGELAGKGESQRFLTELITLCALFSGLTDYQRKTSFNLKITKQLVVNCVIDQGILRLTYSQMFKELEKSPEVHLHPGSTLSVTVGDFSGLHRSTVLADEANVSQIFNFFTRQSEQLPTEFVLKEKTPTVGLVIQPLPFADIDTINEIRDTMANRLESFNQSNWPSVPAFFQNVGTLLWDKKVV